MNGLTRLLFVLVLLGVRTALALDPERHITELVHRVWDRKSGVPSDSRAMTQTTDGYLWIGTLRGLYRFDGIQFQEFEPESGARLPSHEINSLFAAANDRLWIGYRWGGVSVLQRGKLVNYNSVDGFPEGDVGGFAQDQEGRIWVASLSGLACFENGRWRRVGEESGFPGSSAQAVLVDHLGALWVAGKHRIAVLRPHASKFELVDEPYDGQVPRLAESPDGTVWMAETTRALRPVKRPGQAIPEGPTKADCQKRFPDTWQTEHGCRRPDDLEVRVGSAAMLFDRNGSFWVTTLGDGLRRAPYPSRLAKEPIGEFSNALERFTSKDGLSADYVTAISEDREGNIWVATRDGIDQFRNGALAPVTLSSAATRLSIAPDYDGYVVALDNHGNMFSFHDAHNINATHREHGVESLFWSLFRDPFGSIWASGSQGLFCRLVVDRCATRLEVPGGNQQSRGYDHFQLAADGNHRLWAYVAERGLLAFEDGRWSQFSGVPPVPKDAVPTTRYTDPSGRIWFGFRDGRLLSVTDGSGHLYSSEDGLTLGEIRAIDSVGTHVWVGGERGLVLLRGPRFTPVLPFDAPAFGSVSGILEADDGSLWLNEYRGVLRVPASEVSAILQDSSHPIQYDIFDTFDGLPGVTEPISCPTAIRGTDGRLWFTTVNGAARVDPRRLYRNKLPPPVVIQSIVADGRTLSLSSKLELPARTTNLQIAYAGLSLSVPERVQFRYRLKGIEDAWQSVGTRRTAYYTKLPPGSYDFQVIASNEAGIWNKTGAELPIRIIPAWNQTWWFKLLCAAAALLLVYSAFIYRLRSAKVAIQQHLSARLSERERIARELHDTLLQGIQGLLLKFHALANTLPGESSPRQTLDGLLAQTRGVIEEARARVRDLRGMQAPLTNLADLLGAYGGKYLQVSSAEFTVSVMGRASTLNPIAADEALSIAREAIANAFMHADATHIEVEVTYGPRALVLRVRDNGKGMDQATLDSGRAGHWGIVGMRERARSFGAELKIWSRLGSGTAIELDIPAAVAYAPSVQRWGRRWLDVLRSRLPGQRTDRSWF